MMNGKEVIISDSQRYKMLGNGWTCDVIAFLLQFMDAEVVKEAKAMEKQTTLLDILEVR
jgi:two-component SAPR family response regulator